MLENQNNVETAEDITRTILQTIYDIWASFVSHIPYFAASLLIILLTWLVIHISKRISTRFFTNTSLRASLKELIVRLLTIGIWIIGLLIAAMIAFPGLTPVNAFGGLGIASLAIGFAFKDIFEIFFAGILLLWHYIHSKTATTSTVMISRAVLRRPTFE